MQFASFGWQRQMGAGGGGASGDPTALTPELLTALGITTTRTGSVHSHLLATTPGQGFYTAAANEPVFERGTIAGIPVRGLLVQGASNPLVTYSADLTNSAWTKTGCRADRVSSSLVASLSGATQRNFLLNTNSFSGWSVPPLNGEYGVDDPFGGELAATITSSASSQIVLRHANTAVPNRTSQNVVNSLYIRRRSGFGAITLSAPNNVEQDITSLVSENWTRVSATSQTDPVDTGVAFFILRLATSGDKVDVAFPQMEAGSAASEYQSVTSYAETFPASLATGTAANWTVTRTLTRSSAVRKTRWRIEAPEGNVGDVLVGHGDVTGSPLYSDDFSTDTSGEWVRGQGSVDGTITVSGGQLIHTKGAGDAQPAAWVRTIAGFTIGKLYRIAAPVSGTASSCWLRVATLSSGAGQLAVVQNGESVGYFRATATTLYAAIYNNSPTVGETCVVDNITISEVAETTFTPGSFQDIALDEYTGANPQLSIRGTNSGDTVRHYDVQHGEPAAGIPAFKWHPVQGASNANVGATTEGVTISPPATVDLSFIVETPPVSATEFAVFTLYEAASTNDRLQVYFANGSYYLRKNAATDQEIVGSVTEGTQVLIDVQWDGANIRARADRGSWASVAHETIHAFDRLRIGSNHTPANHFWGPIWCVLDRAETVLTTAPHGWNVPALEAYEASL